MLAMSERLAGKLDAAQIHIDAVVQELPIDYLALSEQYLISKARGRDVEASRAHKELWRLLGREPDSALELAFDYWDEGRIGEAIERSGTSRGERFKIPDAALYARLLLWHAQERPARRY